MTMSWSLGETRALAVKAARGIGMSWGIAEEAGFSVQWLQFNNAPGVRALADYLRLCEQTPGGWQPAACPLLCGAAMADDDEYPSTAIAICQPLLLAPFAAAITTSGICRISWQGVEIQVSRNGMQTFKAQDLQDLQDLQGLQDLPGLLCAGQTECAFVYIEGENQELTESTHNQRVPDTEHRYMKMLQEFAARTYAPASEQSRTKGAGAGLDDNE